MIDSKVQVLCNTYNFTHFTMKIGQPLQVIFYESYYIYYICALRV